MLKTLLMATAIMIAFVNVSGQNPGITKRYVSRKAGVVRVGPSTTYLKAGLSLEEVLSLLGEPIAVFDRHSGNQFATTYQFPRDQNRLLIAEFVNGTLISYTIQTRQ